MAIERTLAICKPDAVERGHIGEIIRAIESNQLKIRAMRMVHLTRPMADGFYAVHRDRAFFRELIDFMTRGPSVIMVLEGENAIARWRELMGATDPAKAAEGTLRKRFGASITENAVHGSDGPETARFEIAWFFPGYEVGY
ncbi:MAG: nucleoside-diphosphate kinase [Sandaracinaceae bacterium]|nr:nucleoside-diphosphate kinase [Sandaracinaceae bacterium]